jgi:inosine/xanthosine triphosphatase
MGAKGKATARIALGSANPNKIRGVRLAAEKIFGAGKFSLVGIDVETGVSEQPLGKETLKGAMNRARAVAGKAKGKCDYAVGLESGIFELGGKYFDVQWCAVLHKNKMHMGCSMGFEIPRKEAQKLLKHKITLSKLYFELTGDADIGKKEGVIGHLSGGLLKRSMMAEQAFLCAMVPLMKMKKN